jgi:hypothetical protein
VWWFLAQDEKAAKKRKRDRVVASDAYITDYDFDTKGQWATLQLSFPGSMRRILFVSLLEEIAGKLMLRETPGIKSCRLVKSKEVQAVGGSFHGQGCVCVCVCVGGVRAEGQYACGESVLVSWWWCRSWTGRTRCRWKASTSASCGDKRMCWTWIASFATM